MLGFIENLAFSEIVILLVVAVLVFGGKLPEAAAQAAAQIQRLKRQLSDMRRDSGIDREIDAVKRSMDQIPRLPRTIDVLESVGRDERVPRTTEPPAANPALPPAQPTAANKTSAEPGAAAAPSAGVAATPPPTSPDPQDPPA